MLDCPILVAQQSVAPVELLYSNFNFTIAYVYINVSVQRFLYGVRLQTTVDIGTGVGDGTLCFCPKRSQSCCWCATI